MAVAVDPTQTRRVEIVYSVTAQFPKGRRVIRSLGRPPKRQAQRLAVAVSSAALLASMALGSFASVSLAADDQPACGVHPLDVVVLIDRSGSMESQQSGGQTRSYWAKLAANQLVDALDGGVGNVGVLHHIGLTTFGGTTASVDLALGTSNTGVVHAAIGAISSSGATPLKLGLATGAADLVANGRVRANDLPVLQVVVLLSDGRPSPDPAQRPNDGEISAYLASADVAYSIAIGEGGAGGTQIDLDLMQRLANPTANFRHVAEASDLPGLFADIFTQLTCPQIGIEKTPSVTSLEAPGGDVTYTYEVTNSNPDAALSSVVVSDDKCSPVTYVSGDANDDGKVQSSETWVFSCSATLTVSTTNVATASGAYNGVGFSAQDAATVVVADPTPTATPTPTPTAEVSTPTATPTPTPTAPPASATPTVAQAPVAATTPTETPDVTAVPTETQAQVPVVAIVLPASPTPVAVTPLQVSPSVSADSGGTLGDLVDAAVEQLTRVVKPDAAVAVAATFGFPLGLNVAVLLFLAVQGRVDARDPKLLMGARISTDTVVAFQDEAGL